MRKITEDTVRAFFAGRKFSSGNTQVRFNGSEVIMTLHCHTIAKRSPENGVYISNRGWNTNTTKERLNGILDYLNVPRIYQKKFEWYWKESEVFPLNKWVKV